MRLHDALDYHARERGRADFAVQDGRRLTYAEAGALADRIAAALVTSGLAVGDRVAILAKNQVEYVLLYYAASKAGVVAGAAELPARAGRVGVDRRRRRRAHADRGG